MTRRRSVRRTPRVPPTSDAPPPTYYSLFPFPRVVGLRDALQRGILALYPNPTVTLRPYQWKALPTQDRTFRFRYQSLQFLLGLIGTGDDRDWHEAIRWVRTWARAHAARDSAQDPMAWYPHGAAIRTLVLAAIHREGVRRGLAISGSDLTLIERNLRRHVRFLLDERHFEETNHGLTESIALIDAQRVLEWRSSGRRRGPVSKRAEKIFTLGINRFLGVVRRGVSAQAVHMEGAPAYHVYFLGMTANCLQYLRRVLPAAETDALHNLPSLLARMHDKVWHLSDLRGDLPPIGDTEIVSAETVLRPIRRALGEIASSRRARALRRCPGSRRSPVLYDEEAGFAIFKETAPRRGGRYAVFRIQDRVPLSHVHNDALALFFQDRDVDVFCDSGKYSYNHDDPVRRYLTSRFAHNSAEPRNLEIGDYVVACDRKRLATDLGPAFTASTWIASQRFAHRRTVVFPEKGPERMRVRDEMEGPQGYLLKWHLGAALCLQPVAASARRGAQFTSMEHGIAIEIRADHDVVCRLGRARAGEPLGWRSARWGEKVRCPVLLVRPRTIDARAYCVETVVRKIPAHCGSKGLRLT